MGGCLSAPLDVLDAAKEGNVKALRKCIRDGRSVNRADSRGLTPLHWACLRGHADCVSELLDASANVNVPDLKRCTPLHFAAEHNHPAVVRMLVEAGANVDARNAMLRTPLHVPCRENYLAVCAVLLDAGADEKQLEDVYGNTAFDLAAPAVRPLFKQRVHVSNAYSGSLKEASAAGGGCPPRLVVMQPLPGCRGARPRPRPCPHGHSDAANAAGGGGSYAAAPTTSASEAAAMAAAAAAAAACNGREPRTVVISAAVLEAALGMGTMRVNGRVAGPDTPGTAGTQPLICLQEMASQGGSSSDGRSSACTAWAVPGSSSTASSAATPVDRGAPAAHERQGERDCARAPAWQWAVAASSDDAEEEEANPAEEPESDEVITAGRSGNGVEILHARRYGFAPPPLPPSPPCRFCRHDRDPKRRRSLCPACGSSPGGPLRPLAGRGPKVAAPWRAGKVQRSSSGLAGRQEDFGCEDGRAVVAVTGYSADDAEDSGQGRAFGGNVVAYV